MYLRIIATLALSFVFYIGNSQISYHRLYETTLNDQTGMNDTIFYHMSSTTVTGNVYAMGTKRVILDMDLYEDLSIIFTKHDSKGDISWSRELELGIDSVDITGYGNIAFDSTMDSLMFVFGVEINNEHAEIYGRMDKAASTLDLMKIGGSQLGAVDLTMPDLTPFINSDVLMTPGTQPTISRLGFGNDLLWSRSYVFVNTAGDSILNEVLDIKMTADTTIVFAGSSDESSNRFVVAEVDSNGVQLWAESYAITSSTVTNVLPKVIEPLTDGSFAVAGTLTNEVGTGNTESFIAIIDTVGTLISVKNVLVDMTTSEITSMIQAADGSLWISGLYSASDTAQYFTTNLNVDGTSNWTTIYNVDVSPVAPTATSLLNVQTTGGASLIGHGLKDNVPVMQVMKHDVDGTTPCSDTITTTTIDLMVVTDTLMEQVVNGGVFFDSIGYELTNFMGFSPPVLSINQYEPFCPNEMIDTLLIASVSQVAEENVSYLWSTMEITDTIRVMEDGQYSVTVTITEDVCYSMCDTVELTRYELPAINISQDNSRFCEEMIVVLNGNYTPGAPGETYLWNTMETTPSIEVTEAGVYSITVTDECGEIAMDDMDVSLPVFDPEVFFGSNTIDFCVTGNAILTAGYSGGGVQPVFTWSDGQEGNPIIVESPGSYTVSVSDECGFNVSATNEVEFPVIATEAEIAFNIECDEENPGASTVVFEGTGNGDISLLTFAINEDGGQDQVSQDNPTAGLILADYVIFASDACGEVLDSLAINTTASCGGLLQYPIAFFPQGEDEDSKTFGPIPNDTMNVEQRISDVEFKVFNRWGETVFESNALLDAWDGTHKGEPAPSEVYIWYVSYIIDGQEMIDKGDVTLIR